MTSTPRPHILLLGATGYIGSQFLVTAQRDSKLRDRLKGYTLVALTRDPTNEKSQALGKVWPGIHLVKGTLDDGALLQDEVSKSEIVINCAVSDHEGSIKATISGLQKRSRESSSLNRSPLYIHVSGMGIVNDNARGEQLPETVVGDREKWATDNAFKLGDWKGNMHYTADTLILDAARQRENAIRTILLYPGFVYGIGEGVTKECTLYRIFVDIFTSAGVAWTWGPGYNRWSPVHVKDIATGMVAVLNAAFDGKAKENEDGIYFITDEYAEPMVMNKVAKSIAEILHRRGLISNSATGALPEAVISGFGVKGWLIFGGNVQGRSERLRELGWSPVETQRAGVMDTLAGELDLLLGARELSSDATSTLKTHV